MTTRPLVLVVDDEVRSQEALSRVLSEEFDVLTAGSADEAAKLLEGELVHAILCDQRMPGATGVSFLREVRDRWPDPVRMIVSGYTDSEDIIEGVNGAGIFRYLTKPWDPDELLQTVREAVDLFRLQRSNESASIEMKLAPETLARVVARKKRTLKGLFGFERIVRAESSPMQAVCELADRIAEYDIAVLITGESGTGKDLLARAIHYRSGRSDSPFVAENCGALPDELLESELFGCKRGAFTGAYEDRIGLFEQADGGTIFLDEVGETSPAFQVKLLRVLQEGEIRPLGARRTRKVDVRVIAATNRDLEADVRAQRFRQDLFYRLSAFRVHVPPLRERPADVAPLAERMLADAAQRFGKPCEGFTPGALRCLARYPWPGNVRELQNEVQRMVVLAHARSLDESLVSERLRRVDGRPAPDPAPGAGDAAATLREQVEALEASVIRDALARHDWNITHVADELGLSRVGLRGKLARYGLERADR